MENLKQENNKLREQLYKKCEELEGALAKITELTNVEPTIALDYESEYKYYVERENIASHILKDLIIKNRLDEEDREKIIAFIMKY